MLSIDYHYIIPWTTFGCTNIDFNLYWVFINIFFKSELKSWGCKLTMEREKLLYSNSSPGDKATLLHFLWGENCSTIPVLAMSCIHYLNVSYEIITMKCILFVLNWNTLNSVWNKNACCYFLFIYVAVEGICCNLVDLRIKM